MADRDVCVTHHAGAAIGSSAVLSKHVQREVRQSWVFTSLALSLCLVLDACGRDDGAMSFTAAIFCYEQARACDRLEVAEGCRIAADVCAFGSVTGQGWVVNGGRGL